MPGCPRLVRGGDPRRRREVKQLRAAGAAGIQMVAGRHQDKKFAHIGHRAGTLLPLVRLRRLPYGSTDRTLASYCHRHAYRGCHSTDRTGTPTEAATGSHRHAYGGCHSRIARWRRTATLARLQRLPLSDRALAPYVPCCFGAYMAAFWLLFGSAASTLTGREGVIVMG